MACVIACLWVLYPQAARAAPQNCQIIQTLFEGGHPDTYTTPWADPAIGDFIGTVQRIRFDFRCQFSAGSNAYSLYNRGNPDVYSAGMTAGYDPYWGSAPVLTTAALAARGLGFVAVYRGTSPVTVVPGHTGYLGGLVTSEGNGYYRVSAHMEYRFIKINNNFVVGSTVPVSASPFNIAVFSVSEGVIIPPYYYLNSTGSSIHSIAITLPTITTAQRTCATPYVDDGVIRLPTITPASLPQIGSRGPARSFIIKMDCPTHLGFVGFYIEPVHGVANAAQGVININPNSTAKGIGLQLTTNMRSNAYLIFDIGQRVPVKFGPTNRYAWSTEYIRSPSLYNVFPNLSDPLIDREVSSHYWLDVAVYRTGAVVPGSFNAAIWVHIVYK